MLDSICTLGLSFRTVQLDLRSKLSFSPESAALFLADLQAHKGAYAVVLSTCNRTEIYFSGIDASLIQTKWASFAGVPSDLLAAHTYCKLGGDAVLHLFQVACGLDSSVLGENEILAQVKDAWELTRRHGRVGKALEFLLQNALVASKRVRTETAISRKVTSIGSLAVREARRIAGTLDGKNIVIVGAGRTAERVAKELASFALGGLTVVNRTLSHASALAAKYGAQALPLESLSWALKSADVVFVAVNSDSAVLSPRHIPSDIGSLLILDLGVPITCDPAVEARPGVHLLHMDHLVRKCEENVLARMAELPLANAIIAEELVAFAENCSTREASGPIQALQQHAESVRLANLSHLSSKMVLLTPEAIAVVEELSIRMAKGLVQKPIEKLRDPLLEPVHRALIVEAFGVSEATGYQD
jgi:glutamyl-tRNA reductase